MPKRGKRRASQERSLEKKHTPGRDHNRKSMGRKKVRFKKRAVEKRREKLELARKQWDVWDRLSEEQRLILEELKPTLPRPPNGNEIDDEP